MFRQAAAASSRALRAAPRAAPRPFLQSQFQSAPAFTLRAAQPAVSRWYSDAKESDPAKPAEEAKTEAKKDEKTANGEADSIAELKKALEAKETEARDWKVSDPPIGKPRNNPSHYTDYIQ